MVVIIRKFVIDLKGVLSPIFNSNKHADEETGDKRSMESSDDFSETDNAGYVSKTDVSVTV